MKKNDPDHRRKWYDNYQACQKTAQNAPENGTDIWPSVIHYAVQYQKDKTVQHEIFQKKHIYVQFIVHVSPSFPPVTIRNSLYPLFKNEICQMMTDA